MMTENAMDFRNGFVGLSYLSKEKFNETKPTYLKNLEPKLERFSNYLGKYNNQGRHFTKYFGSAHIR